jgi:Signal transduction histidine kinase
MRNFSRLKMAGRFIGLFLMATVCVAAGYCILSFSKLSGLWRTVCSLWIGVLILAMFGFAVHTLGKDSREKFDRLQHDTLLDAMAQIAQGDFSVFLQTDELIHTELVDAVNTMAKNLGTLESMRQDFISNVSHEIQSPLTSIGGFAALLQADDLAPDERKRYAGIIKAESKRLSSLSDNLLKLSSLDSSTIVKNSFRLDKQLSNIMLTLEPQWSAKNLTIEADFPKCVIEGDEDLLSQVWVNLLVNAIKFTPDNGTICISISENTVKIADTGIGISKDDLPHILERFYKVDKSRDRSLGGNGLGLSLAKKIVELHGGTIAVQSELERGTTFTIVLPQRNSRRLHSV